MLTRGCTRQEFLDYLSTITENERSLAMYLGSIEDLSSDRLREIFNRIPDFINDILLISSLGVDLDMEEFIATFSHIKPSVVALRYSALSDVYLYMPTTNLATFVANIPSTIRYLAPDNMSLAEIADDLQPDRPNRMTWNNDNNRTVIREDISNIFASLVAPDRTNALERLDLRGNLLYKLPVEILSNLLDLLSPIECVDMTCNGFDLLVGEKREQVLQLFLTKGDNLLIDHIPEFQEHKKMVFLSSNIERCAGKFGLFKFTPPKNSISDLNVLSPIFQMAGLKR